MNAKSEYGVELEKLLKKYQDKNESLAQKGFFLFENFIEKALLFIGINPSEVKNIEKKYSIKKENGIYWGKEAFKNEYPYYQHFDDLVCDIEWSHLDIYFSCETSQKNLPDIEHSPFLVEQLSISKKIIQKLEPKIIVVCNAHARDIIKSYYDWKYDFDEEIGTYRIKEINNVPIFFSGMLTGGRALDVGSRERLKWHIRFVKNKLCKIIT